MFQKAHREPDRKLSVSRISLQEIFVEEFLSNFALPFILFLSNNSHFSNSSLACFTFPLQPARCGQAIAAVRGKY